LIVELFCHDPSKNVPFTQVKSLIRHVKFFLSSIVGEADLENT